MKAIMVNPAEEFEVSAPSGIGNVDKFIKRFIFKKPKWDVKKAKEWVLTKMKSIKPKIQETEDEIAITVNQNPCAKLKRIPFHIGEEIYCEIGEKQVLENPKYKITPEVRRLVRHWAKEGKTPKQINTLLEERRLPTIHPATISKIVKGVYPQAKEEVREVEKEVMMKNPLITEILENPQVIEEALQNRVVPLVSTPWFQERAKALLSKGLTFTKAAEEMNKELISNIPADLFRQILGRVRVGKKGTVTRSRRTMVVTPKMIKYFIWRYKIPLRDKWKHLDTDRLKGWAKKLWEEGKDAKGVPGLVKAVIEEWEKDKRKKFKAEDKKALYEVLQRTMYKLRKERKGGAFTSKEAKRLIREFSPSVIGERRVARRAELLERLEKAREAKRAKAETTTTETTKTTKKKKKKKKGVSSEVAVIEDEVMEPIDTEMTVDDFVDSIDEFDIAEMPAEIVDALANPLFRFKAMSMKDFVNKILYQSAGVIGGSWALNLTEKVSNLIFKLIPEGTVKNVLNAVIPSGVVYGLAETLPGQYGLTAESVQTLALYRAYNQLLRIGSFQLVPDITPSVAIPAPPKKEGVKEEIAEDVEYTDEETGDVIEAEISDELYEAWRRGEYTDEEIAQMVFQAYEAPQSEGATLTEQEEIEQEEIEGATLTEQEEIEQTEQEEVEQEEIEQTEQEEIEQEEIEQDVYEIET